MRVRKVATNIPSALLDEAVQLTGLNQTQTLVEGLKELIAKKKRLDLISMRGKVQIRVDIDKTRKRVRS